MSDTRWQPIENFIEDLECGSWTERQRPFALDQETALRIASHLRVLRAEGQAEAAVPPPDLIAKLDDAVEALPDDFVVTRHPDSVRRRLTVADLKAIRELALRAAASVAAPPPQTVATEDPRGLSRLTSKH